MKGAALKITAANPEAVILIGSHKPVVKTIELVRRDLDPIFMTVSFVGSNAFATELGPGGAGIYVTQVVPLPDDENIPVVARYRNALSEYDPQAEPGFVSLEGYLAGRLAAAGLEACGPDLSRECLLRAVREAGDIEIDGMQLRYGPHDNQGSDAVFLTVIGTDGKYHGVEKLTGPAIRPPKQYLRRTSRCPMDGFSLQEIADLFRSAGHTNELHQSLLNIGMLIIVAKLAEGVFRRLRLNAIIAYAATGMFLGPVMELTGVWWIESSLHLQLVLALGVFIFFLPDRPGTKWIFPASWRLSEAITSSRPFCP